MKSLLNKINSDKHYIPKCDYDLNPDKWEEEDKRLFNELKNDALEAAKLKDHPKAEEAFNLALIYSNNHSSSEIFFVLEKFAELLLD